MCIKEPICNKCVMDSTDENIVFNEFGVCNHCIEYSERRKRLISDPVQRKEKLDLLIQEVKEKGRNKKYDCIIGVNGGVDSSYVAYLSKKWKLRTLLVHLDNGWNSELSVKNIENIVNYTGFDLYTYVIDWEEFKDLQRSFFKADVIDLELLSDHAIFATIYKLARKYGVKYILSGENFETEAILAKSWVWRKTDSTNIKAIHKTYGKLKFKTLPFMGTFARNFYQFGGVAQSLPILNYLEYDKNKVIKIIEENMGWKNYGGKHYESIFTRFYQGYILPKKFGVDKRKAHFSTLINSGQMTREEALDNLKKPTYPALLQKEDYDIVCKKLDFSYEELEDYIKRPKKSHLQSKSDEWFFQFIRKVYFKFHLKKFSKYV